MKSVKREDVAALKPETWPDAAEFSLPVDRADRYNRLRSAVTRYSQGLSAGKAAEEARSSRSELYRYMKRCLAKDEGGAVLGHRALEKYLQVLEQRKNDEGKLRAKKATAGAFTLLLERYPRIKKVIDDFVLHKKHPDHKDPLPSVSFPMLFKCFETACYDEKLHAPGYPFNTGNDGRSALRRYRNKLLADQLLGAAAKDDVVRNQLARAARDYYGPYMEAELDGYWMDVDIEIEYEGREPGSVVRIKVKRIWIIPIIEVASTACLGYALAFGPNYPSSAVLSALRHCMLPWKPLTSDSRIAYAQGDGFPSMHEELAYVCFDELHMDNAKAQLSDMTLATIERNYRAVPVFGPIATPNARPYVEGFFAIMEKAGMAAWKTLGAIAARVLRHAVDALFAAYNNSRAPGSTRTRMDTLRDMVASGGTVIRRVPIREREMLLQYDLVDSAVVGRDGQSRVLRWKGARYRGPGLFKVEIDAEVVLYANSADPREIKMMCASTGRDLGLLLVERRWRAQPHDLQVRMWLEKDPSFRNLQSQGADITLALFEHAGSKSQSATQQRKKAVVAQGFASADPHSAAHPPAPATPVAPSQRPQTRSRQPEDALAAGEMPHASHTFINDLLANIGNL
ncbi:hypothetical protein [Variovorax paradoxus]|uniref:hypothetical protein n=1 Tax=Variovorax paradoxus TaxID=34073 RepID=UPI003D65655E